jgi:HTH-like domain
MKFGFIAKHRGIWPVRWMCEALGVSRAGFYAWLTRPRSKRIRSDDELGAKVRASFLASERTYGARRVWHDMIAAGLACGLHRIERLMRLQGLRARPRRRSQRARSRLPSPHYQPQMDCGFHLYLDSRGLALCGGRARPVLAACRRLVDEREHDGPARHRRTDHGILAPRQAGCVAAIPIRAANTPASSSSACWPRTG